MELQFVIVNFDGTKINPSERFSVRINGEDQAVVTPFVDDMKNSSGTFPGVILGASVGGANGWSGELGEVLVYDRILTGSDITELENRLLRKWGV